MAESTDGHPVTELIKEKLAYGVFIVGLWLFGGTFLILSAQFILYLKRGAWPYWALASLGNSIDSYIPSPVHAWLLSPKDWHGLHQVIMFSLVYVLLSPLALDTFILAFILVWAGIKMGGLKD